MEIGIWGAILLSSMVACPSWQVESGKTLLRYIGPITIGALWLNISITNHIGNFCSCCLFIASQPSVFPHVNVIIIKKCAPWIMHVLKVLSDTSKLSTFGRYVAVKFSSEDPFFISMSHKPAYYSQMNVSSHFSCSECMLVLLGINK